MRAKASLAQLLNLLDKKELEVLFTKHCMAGSTDDISEILEIVLAKDNLRELISEIIATKQNIRNSINPKYSFDERWNDFEKCLFLDGYKIDQNKIISISPDIDNRFTFEDELTIEVQSSSLRNKTEILKQVDLSTSSFKDDDFSRCLSDSRLALETIIRNITQDNFNISAKWGPSLSVLKKNNFLTQDEENYTNKSECVA